MDIIPLKRGAAVRTSTAIFVSIPAIVEMLTDCGIKNAKGLGEYIFLQVLDAERRTDLDPGEYRRGIESLDAWLR